MVSCSLALVPQGSGCGGPKSPAILSSLSPPSKNPFMSTLQESPHVHTTRIPSCPTTRIPKCLHYKNPPGPHYRNSPMSTLYKSTCVHTIRVSSCPHYKNPPMSTLQGCAVTINAFIYFTPSFTHSPNLPYFEGICSPAAAILLLKCIEGGKLCRAPCILPEKLCSTFWQQESPAARSLGLHMSRPANSPARSCPTPSNRDEMN